MDPFKKKCETVQESLLKCITDLNVKTTEPRIMKNNERFCKNIHFGELIKYCDDAKYQK